MLKIGLIGNELHCSAYEKAIRNSAHSLLRSSTVRISSGKIFSEESGSSEEEDRFIASNDVIMVTDVHPQLKKIAEKTIRASRHLLLQDISSLTVRDLRKLVTLEEEADVRVQVGNNPRYDQSWSFINAHAKDPMLIETHRLTEFDPEHSRFSVVHDLMIHDIDMTLQLVRSPVKKISSSGVAVLTDSTDIANARIEFDNGAVANLTASRISEKLICKARFFRKDSFATVDYINNLFSVVNNEQNQKNDINSKLDYNKYSYLNSNVLSNIEIPLSNRILNSLNSFAESIINSSVPLVTLDDSANTLEVVNRINDQLKLNTNFAGHTITA
ncbi:MAG: gfo/Idh/MocA family oxidoreductase [Bacteroidetes bacterium]|nr:gfo/Idh/MocA family oxidoreductase [Bacteroidota bacterium]